MRRLDRFKAPDDTVNTLFQVYKTISFWKVLKNTLVIELGRFFPWMGGKRAIYRACLGMEIGEKTAIAYKVMPDLFFRKDYDWRKLNYWLSHNYLDA